MGANASGKSTFLDTVRFLGQVVSEGLDAAIRVRTENLQDLLWQRQGNKFELAIEMQIPEAQRKLLQSEDFSSCRYEICVGIDSTTGENSLFAEKLLLASMAEQNPVQRLLFPQSMEHRPETILMKSHARPEDRHR